MQCEKCGAQNDDQAAFCDKCGADLQKAKPAPTIGVAASAEAVQYAGFWKRLGAGLMDGVLLIVTSFVAVGVICGIVAGGAEDEISDATADALASVAWITAAILGWRYYALMECSSKQTTLGKTVLGVFVTDEEGHRVSFARATGRHFSKILLAIILYIGYIMIAFTAKKQGLHDMVADCLVVRK